MSYDHTGIFQGTVNVYLDRDMVLEMYEDDDKNDPVSTEIINFLDESDEICVSGTVNYEFGSNSGPEVIEILSKSVDDLSKQAGLSILQRFDDHIDDCMMSDEELSPYL